MQLPAFSPPRPWADLVDWGKPAKSKEPQRLLDGIAKALMLDAEWTVRSPLHLQWWAGPFPLNVTAFGPKKCLGRPTVKLQFHVNLLHDVTASQDEVLELLAARNAVASTGAVAWVPKEKRVIATMTHYSNPQTGALDSLLPALALLMYTEVLGIMFQGDIVGLLGGKPAFEPHPQSGMRMTSDALTQVTDQEVIPAGAKGNAFVGSDFASISEHGGPFELYSTADDQGCTAEFPFSSSIPPALASALGRKPMGLTAMAQMMAMRHPGYGQGLTGLLHVPEDGSPAKIRETANRLNLLEFTMGTGFPAWGAWTTQGDRGTLTHASFIPNAYARKGLPSFLMWVEYLRSQWAQEVLLPQEVVKQVRAGAR